MLALVHRPSRYVPKKLPWIVCHCARHLQHSPRILATDKAEPAKPAKGQRIISLLEELFPQSIKRKDFATQNRVERHVPKLALDTDFPTEALVREGTNGVSAAAEARLNTFRQLRHNQQTALLVLQKASKFLTENDFRRAAPRGKYIEGWAFQADILKVIRGRDAKTLEPNGSYFVLFENPTSAQAYRDHVVQLHRQSQAQLPQGLTGPIAPPPTVDASGQVSYGPSEFFTLIPPFQDLDFRMMVQPFPPLLKEVVENGGYKQLVHGRRSNFEVLLTVDWLLLSAGGLRRAVRRDGDERGCPWRTILATGDQTPFRAVHEKQVGAIAGKAPIPGKADRGPRDQRWHGKKRYVISFKDDAEAKRFTFSWNRREISHLLDADFRMPSEKVMADAEVIW